MAAKTFYFLDSIAPGAAALLALQDGGTPPSNATTGTGWTANTNDPATKTYCRMNAGTEIGRLNSQWTTSQRPAGTVDDTFGDAYRSIDTFNGSFAAAAWSFSFGVRSVTAAFTGRFHINFRVASCTGVDGSGVQSVGPVQSSDDTVADLSTTSDTTIAGTWTPASPIVCIGYYLVMQVAIQLVSIGGGNTQDVLFRVGSSYNIVTSDFTPSFFSHWAANANAIAGGYVQ